jgi:hypothetical protein
MLESHLMGAVVCAGIVRGAAPAKQSKATVVMKDWVRMVASDFLIGPTTIVR